MVDLSMMLNRTTRRGTHRRTLLCLLAVAGLSGVEFAVRWAEPALRAFDVADYQRKPGVLRASAMPDIVLLGSSRAKYALVPEDFETLFGRPAFNLAIAGSKTVEWLTLARELFSSHRPKLVVLGVNASEFRADYLPEDAARHLFGWRDLLESLGRDRFSLSVIGHYLRQHVGPVWATYHRRYEIKMWLQERLAFVLPKHAQRSRELRRRVAAPVPSKGYEHPWQRGRQRKDLGQRLLEDRAAVLAASIPKHMDDSPAYLRLEQLLAWLQGRGIAVVVAYLPNSPETERRWGRVEPMMIRSIAEICRNRDVPFLPCDPRDLPRTNHDFLEEIHVGLPLAHRISRRIAGHLRRRSLLGARTDCIAGLRDDDDELP